MQVCICGFRRRVRVQDGDGWRNESSFVRQKSDEETSRRELGEW